MFRRPPGQQVRRTHRLMVGGVALLPGQVCSLVHQAMVMVISRGAELRPGQVGNRRHRVLTDRQPWRECLTATRKKSLGTLTNRAPQEVDLQTRGPEVEDVRMTKTFVARR